MDTFQTIYLMTETSALIGQMMFDLLTVTFAIIGVGLLFGEKLTKEMVIGISVLACLWELPMFANAYSLLQTLAILARSLTPGQLGELGDIARYIGSESIVSANWPSLLLVPIHALLLFASLWFLNFSRVRGSTS